MLMQKIRDKAGWVVVIAVVCFGALIFVDWGMSPGNGLRQKNVVGSVSGEDISVEEFEGQVQNKAKEMTDKGRELNSETYAQIRRAVFIDMVRERLLAKVFKEYNLYGTPEQDLDYIRRNPPPGAEKAPIFMGPDSQFSQALYERWLANPKTFDDRYMRLIEGIASTKTIPELALGRILTNGSVLTSLEMSFRTRLERTRGWGHVVVAPADSFPAPAITEESLRKEFAILTDSFWIGRPRAKMAAAMFSKTPSAADSLRARQDADTVAFRARQGEKFDDLAQQYSEDPGSAKEGGSLGGPRNRGGWVPAFADAVGRLQKGQISDPVLSPFGYHVIKLRDIQIVDRAAPATGKDTLYDVQHVLITISTSPETVDSLKRKLEEIRSLAKGGMDFRKAAQQSGASIDSVSVEKDEIGLMKNPSGGKPRMIPGASAWAFHPQDKGASEVIETAEAMMILSKPKTLSPGRDFDNARDALQVHLDRVERSRKAKSYLEANIARIRACDTSSVCIAQVGKLIVQPLVEQPTNTNVLGLGFAPVGFVSAWGQASKAPKSWTGPVQDVNGALLLRLDSLAVPSAAELAAWNPNIPGRESFVARDIVNELLGARRREAKIKNNLDLFFRD